MPRAKKTEAAEEIMKVDTQKAEYLKKGLQLFSAWFDNLWD